MRAMAQSYVSMIAAPRMCCLWCTWKDSKLQKTNAFFTHLYGKNATIYGWVMGNYNHEPVPGVKFDEHQGCTG